jgi:serine/threonine-protein kinase ULK1
MFNDIWSLGIILLNLATGRNPWKSATPDDQTFQAYLRDPFGFLPTVLPISLELNDILIRMLEVDWRERITLPELRLAIEDVNSFYSDGVIFEGSMARCPWESGMDIDSDSSEDTKGSSLPSRQEDPISRWSKDSSSELVFAQHSNAPSASSYGVPWTEYSSSGATWAFESPSSSTSGDESAGKFARSAKPMEPLSPGPSPPTTRNHFDTLFGKKSKIPPRKALTIDTNLIRPMFYNLNESMVSTKTSIMQTAVEYDPYSSSFYIASTTSNSYASITMPISMPVSVASLNDKEMESPSMWASSATEMSSPSVYSSGSSSADSMEFTRSTTPSPDTAFPREGFRTQVQCLPQSQPSQTSSPVYDIMTDVLSPSRPSIFPSKRSYDASDAGPDASPSSNPSPGTENRTRTPSPKPKTTSIFNPIKFFPRVSSPTPPASPPNQNTTPHARHTSEPPTSPPCDKPCHAPPIPTPRCVMSSQGESAHARATTQRVAARDRRISTFRSPKNWFTHGRFFASTGAH